MDRPTITYAARGSATPEAEIAALAGVYKFVINRPNRNAAGMTSTNGDDAKGSKHDSRQQQYTR